MKKLALSFLIFAVIFPPLIHAKCMSGYSWIKDGKKIVVCLKGDAYTNRKKGEDVCKKIKGGNCGAPNTFSSSCSNGECYDESGKNYFSLSGY